MGRTGVAFILSLVLIQQIFAVPTSFFSTQDKQSAIKTIAAHQNKDGSFNSLKNTYFAVSSSKQLASELSQKDKVCASAQQQIKDSDVESIFYATYVSETLGCGVVINDKVRETLENGLKSTKAIEVAYALASIHYLTQNKHQSTISNDAVNAGVKKLIGFGDDEGLIGGKVFTTGFSLQTLANYVKVDKAGLETLFTNSLEVISQADGDQNLEFPREDAASSLRVTSAYFSGVTTLAHALGKKETLKADQVAQLTETFILHKHASSLEDVHAVAEGLNAAKTSVPSPLVVSLAQSSIASNSKDNIKVRVTDIFGNFASKAKVHLVKGTAEDDKKVILNNQELFGIDNDNSGYALNFLAAKPESGFYTLEFRATPDSNAFLAGKGIQNLKVISQASASDLQVTVSDSLDNQDLTEGKKYKAAEFPGTVDAKISAEYFQFVTVNFKIKSQGSKTIQPHQVFVGVSSATGEESVFPATFDGKQYGVSIPVEELAPKFRGNSGDYSLTLFIGDAFISNSFFWKFGTVHLNFPEKTKSNAPILYAAKPEIVHQFRQPEKRPAKTFSFAFTIATLAPFAFLFIGLIRVGANLSNFPTGAGFIWAVGFQTCLGAILALFALYWLRLNMMQTLVYLGTLSIPTIFFAQKSLSYLAVNNSNNKVKTN